MARHTGIDLLVVGVRGVHEVHAVGAQLAHGGVDVVGAQGDVLDAFAVVLADEFLDLRLVVRRLVDRDADLAAGRGHGAGEQAGELAFDVEVADLAEVGDALVEAGPHVHLPALDVVGQVVDGHQADGVVVGAAAFDELEVDVIDAVRTVAVDEVQQRTADAFDAGDVQLAEVGVAADQLGTLGLDVGGGLGGVLHPEGHGAGARAVLFGELVDVAGRAAVEHDVDVVLLEQPDFLGAVLGGFGEAHGGEQLAQLLDAGGVRRGEFDELETVGTDGIVLLDLGHGVHPASSLLLWDWQREARQAGLDAFISTAAGLSYKPRRGALAQDLPPAPARFPYTAGIPPKPHSSGLTGVTNSLQGGATGCHGRCIAHG
ncbi:hypothetical protein D3C76_834580 [compost metagenome]